MSNKVPKAERWKVYVISAGGAKLLISRPDPPASLAQGARMLSGLGELFAPMWSCMSVVELQLTNQKGVVQVTARPMAEPVLKMVFRT